MVEGVSVWGGGGGGVCVCLWPGLAWGLGDATEVSPVWCSPTPHCCFLSPGFKPGPTMILELLQPLLVQAQAISPASGITGASTPGTRPSWPPGTEMYIVGQLDASNHFDVLIQYILLHLTELLRFRSGWNQPLVEAPSS
jgi:hypothetical protein